MYALLIFIFWGLIKLLEGLFSDFPMVYILGFIGTYHAIFLWGLIFIQCSLDERNYLITKFIKYNLIFGIIVSVFAIYNYFVDPTLFGLNRHIAYSNYDLLERGIITRRAISLIGSPQVIGYYLFLVTAIVLTISYNKIIKLIILIIVTFAGVLSGSSAFMGSLFIFILVYSILEYKIGPKTIGITFLVFLILLIPISFNEAISGAFDLGIKNRMIYYTSFLEISQIKHFIIGRGIGVTDRIVEVFYGGFPPNIWQPKNESYFIKIYYELGIIGLIILTIFMLKSLYYINKNNVLYGNLIFALICGSIANYVFTPTFTGLTMSFYGWLLLLAPSVLKKS